MILVGRIVVLLRHLVVYGLLMWRVRVWNVLRMRLLMGLRSPHPESEIVDCKATHYDGNADDLSDWIRRFVTKQGDEW